MKVVIMAGGQGTRISSIASDIPKPMINIEGKPILEHQIMCLKKQGYKDIILVIGHLGKIIEDYFQDGSSLGVNITYFRETTPLGTAGALFYLKEILLDEFLLLNGDIIFDIDFSKFIDFHKRHNAFVTLLTHPNSHPYDSGIIVTDDENRVVKWLHKEDERSIYKNRVNAGIHLISEKVLHEMKRSEKIDLDRDILEPFIVSKKVYAYDSPEYIKDMGTPKRYHMVCDDFRKGIIFKKNLIHKQKAVFLDRDGTINHHVGFITTPSQIKVMDGVAEAIRLINKSGYLVIVVTNQPVIARGDCTFEELKLIHNKLETELGKKGAYVDDIFLCPHHPDKGFVGERTEFKIVCNCRKPNPGLLLEAAQKYNIELSESYMVGDRESDVECGIRAGCKSVLLSQGNEICVDNRHKQYKTLLDFVYDHITEEK